MALHSAVVLRVLPVGDALQATIPLSSHEIHVPSLPGDAIRRKLRETAAQFYPHSATSEFPSPRADTGVRASAERRTAFPLSPAYPLKYIRGLPNRFLNPVPLLVIGLA